MDIPSLSLVDLGDSVIPQLLWPGHNPRVVQVQQHGAFGEDTTAAISNLRMWNGMDTASRASTKSWNMLKHDPTFIFDR